MEQAKEPLPVCEPCSLNNTHEQAKHYCKDCEEYYCESCLAIHYAQKSSIDHDVRTIEDVLSSVDHMKPHNEKQDNFNRVPLCEPCVVKKKNEHAIHYCKDCEEFYCNRCFASHCTQKSSKNHDVLTIEDVLPSVDHCEPCYGKHRNVIPVNRCQNCEEYLCEKCTKVHRSQKQNKAHTIIPLPKPVSCEPCSLTDTNKVATAFCVDCKDPEPMCDECVDQHKLMKKTRNHNISQDKFTINLKFRRKVDDIETGRQDKDDTIKAQTPITIEQEKVFVDQEKTTEPLCEPCESRGKQTPARYFCNNCEEQYCETCMKKHRISKNNRNHEIGDIPKCAQFTANCDTCEYNKIITMASHFCQNCDEHLCKDCMNIHRSQKMSRDHKIELISAKIVSCAICCEIGEQLPATSFCLDCENPELLCASCALEHTTMRRTKNHELSKDISMFLKSQQKDIQKKKNSERKNQEKKEENLEIPDVIKPHLVKNKTDTPGTPYVTEEENKSDHIILKWNHNGDLGVDEYYQIRMKKHPDGNWKDFKTTNPCIGGLSSVDGLKAKTSYVFKVRVANGRTGEEGSFSSESDVITTGESPAYKIMRLSQKIEDNIPAVYRLPIQEIKPARNEGSQTRKFILGTPGNNTKEKTIMIVGATGSGKSTLINGMANFVMGVTWEDPFRFTLIHLENCEQDRVGNEALSQTEWITCYTLCSDVTKRIDYTINLIDTPGFGDTRGLQQDAKIVSQIRDLFTAKDAKGVTTLDAVCFILKAPDARLTTPQKYIFESILALFGNDIKNNICTLITFADGQKPPVLSALEALDDKPLPYEKFFPFNNSALFTDNSADKQGSLSPFFWDMGMKSCDDFFKSLLILQTRSLLLTSEVLTKRHKLENTILNLQEEIDLCLSKLNLLEQEVNIFKKYNVEIQANENFEYEVDESKMEKIDISGKGIHTTTCLTCNFTCHNNCAYANDDEKKGCVAMGHDGLCTECPKNCNWQQHANVPHVFKWYTQKVKKTYAEMKDKYQQANHKQMSQKDVLKEMHDEIKILETGIQIKINEITKYGNRLKEIALRPDPLSTVQYIELMIESEMREKKSGFNKRVEILQDLKKRADIGKTCKNLEHQLANTRSAMNASNAGFDNAPSDKGDVGIIKMVKNKCKQLIFGNPK